MRNCIVDPCLYDVESEVWSTLNSNLGHCLEEERSPVPVARRNHVAGMLNDHMIIYGGIDNYQKNLNDVASLNLTNGKWTTIYAASTSEEKTLERTMSAEKSIPALSRAKACMAFHSQRSHQQIPSLDEIPFVQWKKAEDLLKFEGMYIFGGLHNDGKINN